MFFKDSPLDPKSFIEKFDSKNDKEKFDSIHELISNNQIGLLLKLVNLNTEICTICMKDEFKDYWTAAWCQCGPYASGKKETFFPQDNEHPFFLFSGFYYFNLSKIIRQSNVSNPNMSKEEEVFLLKAINYNSIHAAYRYCNHLFTRANSQEKEIATQTLTESIKIASRCVPVWSAFAYGIMVEGYIQLARLEQKNDPIKANRAITAAKTAWENAVMMAKTYPNVFYNASASYTLPWGEFTIYASNHGFDEALSQLVTANEEFHSPSSSH